MAVRPLFGGTLSCAIPDGFADVSAFRQVPDNQEVFANAHTDQCIIIELLQFESGVANEESGQYFFNEIAHSNGCSPADVRVLEKRIIPREEGPSINAECVSSVVVGDQHVAKFKEGENAKNVVRVYLGNIRLPHVTTDVVISVSVPMQINPASSSSECSQLTNSAEVGAQVFQTVHRSFQVHDWTLFG
ncbi:TPA: hypothetical protein N0F65_010012 [Lagenidium giganteum]|uniref:Ran guanine nucleotide release factor n=1 Tax=Lagenidium giganteum TaxID=4803 RepID=A0AAV2ZDT6_9STRA|nr:TPA: hypothetical protein N0F65_010012 [Lagenidium giganteum]